MNKAIQLNVTGSKNSGKTRIAVSLIRELTARGFNVGSVKHTSHDHEYDLEGTDSWKHHQAGTVSTLISSPQKLVCHMRELSALKEQTIMEAAFSDCDFIIWEGDRETNNSVIKCLAAGDSTQEKDDRLIAVISETPVDNGVECFGFEESQELCEFVMDQFSKDNNNWT